MYNDFLSKLKNRISSFVNNRTSMLILLFCVTSFILVQRVFFLQIVQGQEFLDNYKIQIQKTKEVEGTRGNIYDRNGKILATNKLAYAVTIEDNGEYDSRKEKNAELNKVITTVINMVESNGDTAINNFGIILDPDGKYAFTSKSNTQQLRFIADVFGQASVKKLTEEQKNMNPDDIIEYLCTDPMYGYGIDAKKMTKQEILKLINIRYAISLNSYQKYIATTIANEVSDKTVADVMENLSDLQGVDVKEESVRKYTDSKCFANIIGYTGQISLDEYNNLTKAEKKRYDKNDTVGKAGLEKEMDSLLKGEKGEEKIYVNNVGKVIETVQGKQAEAGNDLYLSIDADLQVAAYNILEQELAGILMSKISNTLSFDRTSVSDGSDVVIPVGDVYNAFISNDLIDISHFSDEFAKQTEKKVYDNFQKRKEKILKKLEKNLKDPKHKPYRDMSKEWQAYLTFVVTDMLTSQSKLIVSGSIDPDDETYIAWKQDESINANKYLNYCISKNWIDTSKLNTGDEKDQKYTDSSEVYEKMIQYIMSNLENNSNFDKLIYKYMIKSGKLTGRQVCMILYEQEILEYSEDQYNRLDSGSLKAYDFVRGKIEDLRITPGQLGLEPCTGSMVMTDVKTGKVLACVSYPGYDNNKIANSMDSSYYNQLVTDQSRPFYNNATQEKTAPGSTYKPLTTIAGLTEGVVSTSDFLACNGIYERVEPNPKCWAYPDSHGNLNAEEAIEHSCNCYFYEVGYRLSLTTKNDEDENGNDGIVAKEEKESDDEENDTPKKKEKRFYSSTVGTDKLKKYAELFGLNETSGIEVPEAEPEISDKMSIPSAIGQGTNNYTTSQLARYITAVANKGTVFKLSILDKTATPEGETIEEFKPVVRNTLNEVADSTWNAVHTGMRNVVLSEQSSIFTEINRSDLKLSGKTGTAQQSKTHPDHGLFVGFAPSESPEIAFAIRIANGYSSHNAAEVGRDVIKYYYELAPEKKIITGKANIIQSSSGGD